MKVLEAPNGYTGDLPRPWTFMAGGISGCPDWQAELISYLQRIEDGPGRPSFWRPHTLLNPRRPNFPIHDPNASREQIAWEFIGLQAADRILFWFSRGSLNPIVLFELGCYLHHDHIIVGCDPEYPRLADVQIQLRLRRRDVPVIVGWEPFQRRVTNILQSGPRGL